jgi:hypothetical protein
MTLKSRIEKLRTKAGLDRCVCEGELLKSIVLYPGDVLMPDSQSCCCRCGRSLVLVINIVYVEPEPPAWFTDELGGIDAETTKQKWLEHLESRVPETEAAASSIDRNFSIAAGCVFPDSPPVSNVEGV